MNDTNSIGAINGIIGQGVPCGTNSEKKCSLWSQKPTTRTIAKDSTASTPVMVKWPLTVSGCRPPSAQGPIPSKLHNHMHMKSEKTYGVHMRPSGPTFVAVLDEQAHAKTLTTTYQAPETTT